ncbi:TRAP transporter small permease [Paracoccus sp. WLY502]|uniref:TRAP transporter small permease n=1 Tax=Paracoccus yibinensis TaxID=3068891 RepID=UPI0027967BDD|nr:TRAP transporter small permease [Paracoccus sp. WLY502]MDQ1901815.1 TRAP transporter small permease [Paracoccus sp. WLY502]
MTALRRGLDFLLGFVCCALLAGLVVVLAWQVVSRYALNEPSSMTEEILRYGVIWMSMLGAAYAVGQGSHLSVDMLRDRLAQTGRMRLDALIAVAFVIFAGGVLIYGGMRAVTIAARQTSAVMQLPMSWIYLSLPVSGALMVLYSILNLIDLGRGVTHHVDLEDADMVGE